MRDRKWAEKKAHDLVARMTLKERMSQLRYDAPAIERLGIPAYNWWNEALHGVARAGTATVFPQAISLGASFDVDLVSQVAEVIATEGRAKYNEALKHDDRDIYKGLTFWSPNVNIFRDPRWGRGQETYGEDPYLTSTLGCAFVKGMQQDGKFMKVAACAKHFAVHSGPEDLRHGFDAKASLKDMEETYLPAFKALVTEAGVEAVMGAYNRTNGEPCCAHTFLQQKLRGEWGFQGHFVSDCWAIRDFHGQHHVTKNAVESAALALKRGCDVNCGCTYLQLESAFSKGLVTKEEITRACERLFTTRYLLGMFEKTEWDDLGLEDVETKEHVDLACKAAVAGSVLLKNNGVLPFSKSIRTIGVIGPNADNRIALLGNYHGTSSTLVTPLEGIRKEAESRGIRVFYSLGAPLTERKDESLAKDGDRLSEALCVVAHSDVVVLVLGLDETLEGEQQDMSNNGWGADKTSLVLPGMQQQLLETVLQAGKPTIVVVEAGSAVDLNYAQEHAAAILDIWYPGAGGGTALAQMLFGVSAPTGKLPVTFYKSLEGLPAYTDYTMRGRTYRYVDSDKVLYPFGYGLTYGKAKIANASCQTADENQIITVDIIADQNMVETLQVYIQDLEGPYAPPNPVLVACKKVELQKGQTNQYSLTLFRKAFETVSDEGVHGVFGKRFAIYVGLSQPDAVSCSLLGTQPSVLQVSLHD